MLSEHAPRRLAIVTGASRRQGIGAAVCRALAQAGIDIFFTNISVLDARLMSSHGGRLYSE
jgi:3-oxoacyl-[acyl-carrier protein] reductase